MNIIVYFLGRGKLIDNASYLSDFVGLVRKCKMKILVCRKDKCLKFMHLEIGEESAIIDVI